MCGIVGYATSKNKWDYEKFFKQALMVDVIRGFDSTGVVVGNDQGFKYTKKAVNAIDFLDMKSVEKIVNHLPVNRPAFMIGHNRAATVGAVDSSNAHPFNHGDLCGVHNGTLRQYWKLDRSKEFGTDSEALYFNLSRAPVDEVLSNVSGAYALVWWDNAKGTVNIIRNDDRPLAVAKVEGEDTILWASEAGMLRWIAGRNGLKIESVIEPKPNVLISLHLDSKELANFEYNQLEVKNNYPLGGQANQGGNQRSAAVSGGSNQGSQKTLPNNSTHYNKNKALEVLGIKLHSTKYPVYIDDFEPYTTTPEFGQITAWMMVEPWMEVRLKAMPIGDYEKMKGKEVQVRLTNLNVDNGRLWEAYVDGYFPREKEGTDDKNVAETFIGPDGKLVSLHTMYELTTEGCMLCRKHITRQDFDWTDFIDGKPVCPECIAMDAGNFEA